MSRKTLTRRRWGLVSLAVALTLTVVAVPASAKGPAFPPYSGCSPATEDGIGLRAPCESGEAAAGRQGSGGAGADILGGSVAAIVLMTAGGVLLVVHRQDGAGRRPAALRYQTGGTKR